MISSRILSELSMVESLLIFELEMRMATFLILQGTFHGKTQFSTNVQTNGLFYSNRITICLDIYDVTTITIIIVYQMATGGHFSAVIKDHISIFRLNSDSKR